MLELSDVGGHMIKVLQLPIVSMLQTERYSLHKEIENTAKHQMENLELKNTITETQNLSTQTL